MAPVDRAESLQRLAGSATGHLATVRPDGRPHVVVVTFAVCNDHVVTAVDHKPKMTTELQRLTNIRASGNASFLVDHYDQDWSQLWWVRVDGPATVHESGPPWDEGIKALVDRYPQYELNPPSGPLIALEIQDVISWAYTP